MKADIKKIAVLRANALGDFILTLPAFQALKETYPQAEIVLLGRKKHREFFQGRRGPIDRIIVLPDFIQFDESLHQPSQEVQNYLDELRKENFDVAIQLHGGGRYSNAFIKKMGAAFSIGARTPGAPALDINVPYTQFQHEIIRQLEIVKLAGANTKRISPHLHLTEDEIERARSLLTKLGFSHSHSSSTILINPGATDPRRRWPVHNFSLLINHLVSFGHRILVNVGPGEEEIADQLNNTLTFRKGVAFIRPDLNELTGLLSLADLLITNDTGTMHLAMALQRPTVALFWFRNLLNYGPLVSVTNRILISWQVECPSCGVNCVNQSCLHQDSLICGISTQDVLEAAQDLLAKQPFKEDEYEKQN